MWSPLRAHRRRTAPARPDAAKRGWVRAGADGAGGGRMDLDGVDPQGGGGQSGLDHLSRAGEPEGGGVDGDPPGGHLDPDPVEPFDLGGSKQVTLTGAVASEVDADAGHREPVDDRSQGFFVEAIT